MDPFLFIQLHLQCIRWMYNQQRRPRDFQRESKNTSRTGESRSKIQHRNPPFIRKKHTVYLHPFPQRKNIEHLECYLHHQCKIPRRRCGSAVYHLSDRKRRSFMDMPPTPFDIKEDTTAIAPSPAVRAGQSTTTRVRRSGEKALASSSPDIPHVPLSSHTPLTPVVPYHHVSMISSSNARASPITTMAARRATRMSFETPQDMEAIRGLFRACQKLEETTRDSSEIKPSRSALSSTTRKKRVPSVTQEIPAARRRTHRRKLHYYLSCPPASESFPEKPKKNTFTTKTRKKRVTQEIPSTRRRTYSTESPMLPLLSLQASVKLSKANSPGLTEKHAYITRQTSSDKVEVEDNLKMEKIEPDLHSKVSGSRRDSYPERPGTRIQQ